MGSESPLIDTEAPHDSAALLRAANAYGAAKNFARAEALLVTAIEVDPASIDAYSMLGRIYLAQKRLDAARAQFEKIAARQEKPVGTLTLIGTRVTSDGAAALRKKLPSLKIVR